MTNQGFTVVGSEDGVVVRALASHKCGLGLIPGLTSNTCCWFPSLLQEVSLWVYQFSPLLNNQYNFRNLNLIKRVPPICSILEIHCLNDT